MVSGTEGEASESNHSGELRLTGFELFVLTLSLYSILNLILLLLPLTSEQNQIVLIMDAAVGVFFLIDFLRRLKQAPNRRQYFFREHGWLDLIAGIPAPGFRLAKVVRIRESIAQLRHGGFRNVDIRSSSGRATITLLIAVMATVLVVQFGSMLVVEPERKASGSNIETAGDAIWWSYVTITTVGYGDKYPVTLQGRLVGFLMLSLGITIFAVITSYLSNAFINPRRAREYEQRQREEHAAMLSDLQRSIDALRGELADLRQELHRQ